MINYIEFINKVSGIVKEAAAAPAPVQEKEPGVIYMVQPAELQAITGIMEQYAIV